MAQQAPAARFEAWLGRNHELATEIQAAGYPLAHFQALQHWQRERLQLSYADLHAEARYQAATHFFLEELYGGLDFIQRDQQVARILPVMNRLMPPRVLDIMATAFELQALSISLDMGMTAVAVDAGHDPESLHPGKLDASGYGELYRACGEPESRSSQIDLIGVLGRGLESVVHKRMILTLVRMLRGPARAAGFAALQDFLEEGLTAFRSMGEAEHFVRTIENREREFSRRLFAGEVVDFGAAAAP